MIQTNYILGTGNFKCRAYAMLTHYNNLRINKYDFLSCTYYLDLDFSFHVVTLYHLVLDVVIIILKYSPGGEYPDL